MAVNPEDVSAVRALIADPPGSGSLLTDETLGVYLDLNARNTATHTDTTTTLTT